MELSQSEDSHDPDDLGVHFVDTSDSHDDSNLGSSWYIDLTVLFSVSSLSDFLGDSFIMFFIILLRFFEDFGSTGLVGSSSIFSLLFEGSLDFRISVLFLLLTFWFGWNFLLCHWWLINLD